MSKSLIRILVALLLIQLLACKTVRNDGMVDHDPGKATNPPKEEVIEVTEAPTKTIEVGDAADVILDKEIPPTVKPAEMMEDVEFSEAPAGRAEFKSRMPEMSAMSSSRAAESRGVKVKPPKEISEAGQITAGEWNDLNNWDKWKDLIQNKDYTEMQDHWKIYPRSRYSIFAMNKYELPLADMKIELLDKKGQVVWTARTDNSGKAELWADIFDADRSFENYDARIHTAKETKVISDIKTIEEGVNHVVVDMECRTPANVDVLFVVDATGSMGDEIAYLQRELQDVIDRSSNGNSDLKLRTGSVFYRDTQDEYLTRSEPLSTDPTKTVNFIKAQSAQGGGDYPEAVDAALDEALAQDWSEDAVARIIFMVLDAPPHHDSTTMIKLQGQIAEAAELGIKIIPISASGINRQTEFLMKFLAIGTNGTYVFITDHSGIGGAHLDPVVQDFEVEKLNSLMVRLLYNYTKSNGCNANEPTSPIVKLYPNPASNYVNVNTTKPLKEVKVTSNSGQLLSTIRELGLGETKIELSEFIDGIYTVTCYGEGFEYAQKVVVVNGN